jgi:hypothetical protein
MSQSGPDESMIALHKKRESASIINPDLYFEDTLITQHGLTDAKSLFNEFSSQQHLNNEGAEELTKLHVPLQQEFARKYLLPRNARSYEVNHQQKDEYGARDQIDSAMFQIPTNEPYKRISAGELYRYNLLLLFLLEIQIANLSRK